MAKRALVPPMSTATISIYSRDAFLEKSGAPRGDGRQIPAFVPFRVADLAFLRLHRAKKGAWQRTRFRSHCLCRLPGLRSEEHTSELQSLMRISYAVFCLKKKTKKKATDDREP